MPSGGAGWMLLLLAGGAAGLFAVDMVSRRMRRRQESPPPSEETSPRRKRRPPKPRPPSRVNRRAVIPRQPDAGGETEAPYGSAWSSAGLAGFLTAVLMTCLVLFIAALTFAE